MKKLLLLLFCLPALAQTGFKADGKDIIWQKSFSAESADIASILDRNPNLKVGGFMDNMYKGMAMDIKNTCTGGTGLMENHIKFDFVILTDPAGYVVKVRNLKILEKYGPLQSRIRANPAENYFMDGEALKTEGVAEQNMVCLDSFLASLFAPSTEIQAPNPTAVTIND